MEIFEKRNLLKQLNSEVEGFKKELETVTKELNAKINNALTKLKSEENAFKKIEEEYNTFNPSRYEFMEDVEKGRKIKAEKNGKSYDYSDAGDCRGSNYENRAAEFSSADGFPGYTP